MKKLYRLSMEELACSDYFHGAGCAAVLPAKEIRDLPVSCYCYSGTPTCWHAEKSGALPVVLNIYCSDPDFFDTLWFSNESWLHLLGYLNSQSACVWAAANSHALSFTESRDVVCCIMYLHSGPIFFHMAVNCVCFKIFQNQLVDKELTLSCFQQDGEMCHTLNWGLNKIN
jgi:hypothetical protein